MLNNSATDVNVTMDRMNESKSIICIDSVLWRLNNIILNNALFYNYTDLLQTTNILNHMFQSYKILNFIKGDSKFEFWMVISKDESDTYIV